jgi:CheY-like chemotaxis protein
VTTGRSGSHIFVKVADTGCGISPERVPKIFLPFFSGKGEHAGDDPSQSALRGSGLGLSISDTIVRNHGGEITVVSAPGRGAEFTVWLPGVEPAPRPPRSAPTKEQSTPAPGPQARGGRVLVLDDELDVRELLRSVLALDGHELLCTGDGQLALAEQAQRPFDVALVDLQMAGMNGFEFLSQLGSDRPEVVVITGRLQTDLEQVRQLGAAELLMKPFDVNYLRRLVQTLLARRQARRLA